MDRKKLNLKLEAFSSENTMNSNDRNIWAKLMQEMIEKIDRTTKEIESFKDIITMKDIQLGELQNKYSELQFKSSIYKEKISLYSEKINDKGDLMAQLSVENLLMKNKIDKLVELLSATRNQQETYNERILANEINIKMKDNHIAKLQNQIKSNELKLNNKDCLLQARINLFEERINAKNELIDALNRSIDNNDVQNDKYFSSIQTKMDELLKQQTSTQSKLGTLKQKKLKLISKRTQTSDNYISDCDKDMELLTLQSKIESDKITLGENNTQIEDNKSQIVNLETNIKKLTLSNTILSLELAKSTDQLTDYIDHIEHWKKQIRLSLTYATSSGLIMHIPGLKPFPVAIENNIAGPNSIIIQRRIDGSVNFDRDLDDYRNGFGNLNEDFWIGLDRLHKITNYQQHELFIHLIDYNDKSHCAIYDNFVVGSKHEKYRLKSLGAFKGNAGDMLRFNEKQPFSIATKNKSFKNGWWWLQLIAPTTNLNGKFSKTKIEEANYIYWGNRNFVKHVKMSIRSI